MQNQLSRAPTRKGSSAHPSARALQLHLVPRLTAREGGHLVGAVAAVDAALRSGLSAVGAVLALTLRPPALHVLLLRGLAVAAHATVGDRSAAVGVGTLVAACAHALVPVGGVPSVGGRAIALLLLHARSGGGVVLLLLRLLRAHLLRESRGASVTGQCAVVVACKQSTAARGQPASHHKPSTEV